MRQPQQIDQYKSVSFDFKNTKPFGAPFDHFKPAYHQQYQSGQYKANYQPFGPYPGYPGPVVYPGQGNYPGPAAYPTPTPYHHEQGHYPQPTPYPQPTSYPQQLGYYPQPAYRFNGPDHKSCGFQHFAPPPPHPAFHHFNFGSTKKFNENVPGFSHFNVPGKYFQEHQFGTHHSPEFSSAIVPAEHHMKFTKPFKDTFLNNPFAPHDKVVSTFPPTLSAFPLPNFPKTEVCVL